MPADPGMAGTGSGWKPLPSPSLKEFAAVWLLVVTASTLREDWNNCLPVVLDYLIPPLRVCHYSAVAHSVVGTRSLSSRCSLAR